MEWIGLSGCIVLSIACLIKGIQFWKAHQRTKARLALAAVVYLALSSWLIVGYYSTNSLLNAIVKSIPVEFGIGFLILFHAFLLVYSVKHPPFAKRTEWSLAKRSLFRQALLLAEGAVICFYCYCGTSFRDASLYLASKDGDYAEVQRCLALGANPAGGISIGGFVDEPVNRCLETALGHKHFDVAQLLVDHGAPLDDPDPMTHMTPLMYEASHHNKAGVLFLIDQGSNINITTGNGLTALKFAANDTAIAQILIDHGIFINTASRNGSTAIFDFARVGNATGTQLLIDHGAKVPVVTLAGSTPLMAAARSGSAQTAAELIAAGVTCNTVDSSGRDALWYAKIGKHKEVVDIIERQMKLTTSAAVLHKRELNDTLTL